MTVFSSGISMYAMGALLRLLLGWNIHASIVVSAVVVLGYIALGGLRSAIYNEVVQFFLIVFGFVPLVWLGLRDIGGWSGLASRVPDTYLRSWQYIGSAQANPMGIEWFGMVMGLGFVLSFGYWCTDFLVVQRAMAADSMNSARRTPLIAAVPKMLFPFIVILPGLIAIALPTPATQSTIQVASTQGMVPAANAGMGLIPAKLEPGTNRPLLDKNGNPQLDYDLAIPQMLLHYFPTGMLGLGLTALLASFMSGMA